MSASSSRGFVEPAVLAFLVLAALALGWLHWKVLPERGRPDPLPFDLTNPMLDAEVGECVAVESESTPEELTCVRVRPPGVVLRPHRAALRLPRLGDLRRAPPFLVCEVRFVAPGKGCDDPPAGTEVDVYPLGGYGLPLSVIALLESIQPRWIERGGRFRFLYEIQMRRYGQYVQGPMILYVDPEQPVGGVVLRRDAFFEGDPQNVLFTPVDCR